MKRNESGFTMTEVVIVVAIIGIMASIAVPNVLNWLPQYRLKSAGRDLHSNFQKAKMEAMKRNTNVVLAFSPPPANDSYQIFVDDGTGGGTANDFIQNGGEIILETVNLARSGLPASQIDYHGDVTLNSVSFSGTTNQTGFNGRGMVVKGGTPSVITSGTAVLRKNDQGTNPLFYKIILSIAGHIRSERNP